MPEEASPAKPRKPRVKRAAPAALLPIVAKVTLRGVKAPIEMGCMSARQSGGFWVFVSPAEGGQVDVTRIAIDQVAMIVIRQWPTPELFQDGPREALAPASALPAQGRPEGPRMHLSPALAALHEGEALPPQGPSSFRGLGSFSAAPFGGPGDLPPS